jgi:hypothetical protein
VIRRGRWGMQLSWWPPHPCRRRRGSRGLDWGITLALWDGSDLEVVEVKRGDGRRGWGEGGPGRFCRGSAGARAEA